MATLTIQYRLWHRISDLIQDMGNHHPNFTGTDKGAELDVLGNAIKWGVPHSPGAEIDPAAQLLMEQAKQIVLKHGGGREGLSDVEQCIETAEKLLGLWTTT